MQLPSEFELFDADKWAEWIMSTARGQSAPPPFTVPHRELDEVLVYLFLEIQNRENFLKGLTIAFETIYIGTVNVRQLYFILNAIAEIRPVGCKRILHRYIVAKRFAGLEYHNVNLEKIALAARASYDIDDEALSMLLLFAHRSEDPRSLIFYLRIISKRDPLYAYRLLPRLLPLLAGDAESHALVRVLKGIVFRNGFRELFKWYKENVDNFQKPLLSILNSCLKRVAPWGQENLLRDPYGILLSAATASDERIFTVEEILQISEAANDPLLLTNKEAVIWVLKMIWLKSRENMREIEGYPFAYLESKFGEIEETSSEIVFPVLVTTRKGKVNVLPSQDAARVLKELEIAGVMTTPQLASTARLAPSRVRSILAGLKERDLIVESVEGFVRAK